MKWPMVKLGDVCRVIPGFAFKSAAFQVDGIPVVKIANIRDDYTVDLADAQCWPQELFSERLQKFVLKDKDILVAMTGATAGKFGRVRTSQNLLLNQRVAKIEPIKAEPDFIWCALSSERYREQFYSIAGGAAQPNMSGGQIEAVEIPLPPTSAQKRIADVLSAYDEMLENNRRRMGLLEEAARLLYREWFVRLRFPGHEHTRLTNGIPEGWTAYTLDDLCLIGRGASPRPIASFMDGEVPWFRIADATASESFYIFHTAEHVTDEGAKKSILLEPGALILSNSATCGIPYFTGVRGCIHDGWLHFANLNRISQQFLYCYLHFKRNELVSSVGDGSTQKNLNTTAVGRLKVALPAQDSLLEQFEESVEPMFKMIFNLARQNISLRAARDLLLPRLMNGEIST